MKLQLTKEQANLFKLIGNMACIGEDKYYSLPQWFSIDETNLATEYFDEVDLPKDLQQINLKTAIEVLCTELRKDKSEGSYYYSWQANIAAAFQDEFWESFAKEDEELFLKIESSFIHIIANQAAKNFLDLLINK